MSEGTPDELGRMKRERDFYRACSSSVVRNASSPCSRMRWRWSST